MFKLNQQDCGVEFSVIGKPKSDNSFHGDQSRKAELKAKEGMTGLAEPKANKMGPPFRQTYVSPTRGLRALYMPQLRRGIYRGSV